MTQLTPRQRAVLDYIWEQVQKRKPPPTVREIAGHFGWTSTNAVTEHLTQLARKGWIETAYYKSRGLRLTKAARRALSGFPLVRIEEITER
jgi:repressor LexA